MVERIKSITLRLWPLWAMLILRLSHPLFISFSVNPRLSRYIACCLPMLVHGLMLGFCELRLLPKLTLAAIFLGWLSIEVLGIRNAYNEYLLSLLAQLPFTWHWKYGYAIWLSVDVIYMVLCTIFPLFGMIGLIISIQKHRRYQYSSSSQKQNKEILGGARIANKKEINRLIKDHGLPVGILPKIHDYQTIKKVVKAVQKQKTGPLVRLETHHAIMVAPTRSGKGIGFVVPVLLDYEGPVFVIDPKSELIAITLNRRRALGRKVRIFDPFQKTGLGNTKLNVLELLSEDSPTLVEDAAMIAHFFCPELPYDSSNTKHFQNQAASLIEALILYVVCSDEISLKDKHIIKVYDLLCGEGEHIHQKLKMLGEMTYLAHGVLARTARSLAMTHVEEFSGIVSTARVELKFLDTPSMRSHLTESNFSLKDMANSCNDFYLCLTPDRLETYKRLIRLITSYVSTWVQREHHRLGHQNVLMMLEEMPSLGHLHFVEQALTMGAGLGIQVIGITQTLEKLQSTYPKDWKTFLSSNMALFLGINDKETAQYLSETMGQVTVQVHGFSEGMSDQKRTQGLAQTSSTQTGQSVHVTGRPLIMPREIMDLGTNVIMVLKAGEKPMLLKRLDYRTTKVWQGLFEENPLYKNRA